MTFMLVAGHSYLLTVHHISDHGLYLRDDQENEVLLPNRYVSLAHKPGVQIGVFVYHDSENRLVATTETPQAMVGQVAFLRVVDKTIHGAFLDWGLSAKHLFLPNRNLKNPVEVGRSYPVFLYNDNVTGRVVASALLKSFIDNAEVTVQPGEEVDMLVVSQSTIGFRVVVNQRHWGMIYHNQIFQPVAPGSFMKGYVVRITEDNRIDLSVQQHGYDEVKASAERLMDLIHQHGGSLPVQDNSDPELIRRFTQLSKKGFKRCAGYLMKQGKISMNEQGIHSIPDTML